jgi:hypothetical protein
MVKSAWLACLVFSSFQVSKILRDLIDFGAILWRPYLMTGMPCCIDYFGIINAQGGGVQPSLSLIDDILVVFFSHFATCQEVSDSMMPRVDTDFVCGPLGMVGPRRTER